MTANLLARQIVEHLSGLSGFYDREQILLGDRIREKIVSGATSALAFLQVVSKPMLDPNQDENKNWCFKEYCSYKNGGSLDSTLARDRQRLFIFLIAERSVQGKPTQGKPAEAVRPFVDLRDSYKPWHDHMLELATITLDCFSRVTLREQIETIAQQVHEFRHSVLDAAVPDEFAAILDQ